MVKYTVLDEIIFDLECITKDPLFADLFIQILKNSVIDIPDEMFKHININIKENSNTIIFTYFEWLCEILIKSIPSDAYVHNVKTGGKIIMKHKTISSDIIVKFKILSDYISDDETNPAYQKYFNRHE